MIPRKRRPIPQTNSLEVASARDFRGGLNTHDTPLNLASKYLIKLRNLYPDTNGRLQLRFGTSKVGEATLGFGDIVAMEYYNGKLVLVSSLGRIGTLTGDGTFTQVWTSWTATTRAHFTPFDGKLVICNGVDKPAIMSPTYVVSFLGDPGNAGSNVNVPRALFCATFNQYLVLATGASGGSTTPSTLFIASKGTAAVMVGDVGADNNAVNYIISRDVPRGDPAITGLVGFRDRLLVATAECVVPMVLGEIEASKHVPRSGDVIEAFGAVSQNTMVPLGDDILLLDVSGVSSVQRAIVTGSLSPVRESTLIGKELQRATRKFTPAQLALGTFAVYDHAAQHVLFFVCKDPGVTVESDNDVFVYCFDKSQRFRAWTYFDELPFRCGCNSAENRVFLARGRVVFFYHNLYEPLYVNSLVPVKQPWSDGTFWTDLTGWSETTSGAPIPFSMSTTWSEFRKPAVNKYTRHLQLDCEGDGAMSVRMYADRIATPTLSMDVQVNPTPEDAEDYLRPLNQKMLYAWPAKFVRARFEIDGTADKYLSIVGLHVHYSTAAIGG